MSSGPSRPRGEHWINTKQVCEILGVSKRCVKSMRERKLLPFKGQNTNRMYYYDRRFVLRMKQEQGYYNPAAKRVVYTRPRWWYDKDALAQFRTAQEKLSQDVMAWSHRVWGTMGKYKQWRMDFDQVCKEQVQLRLRQKQLERATREALAAIESGKVILMHRGDVKKLREKLVPPDYIEELVQERLTTIRIGEHLNEMQAHG